MTPHYPLGRDIEETDERPRTISVTDDDMKGIHCSTRQIWAEEEKQDALLAGWDACLKRRIAAEKPLISED